MQRHVWQKWVQHHASMMYFNSIWWNLQHSQASVWILLYFWRMTARDYIYLREKSISHVKTWSPQAHWTLTGNSAPLPWNQSGLISSHPSSAYTPPEMRNWNLLFQDWWSHGSSLFPSRQALVLQLQSAHSIICSVMIWTNLPVLLTGFFKVPGNSSMFSFVFSSYVFKELIQNA